MKTQINPFTQSELQFLKARIADHITNINDIRIDVGSACHQLYDLCDKNNPETSEAFAEFSEVNKLRRRLKREAVSLAKIQYKIKSLLSE